MSKTRRELLEHHDGFEGRDIFEPDSESQEIINKRKARNNTKPTSVSTHTSDLSTIPTLRALAEGGTEAYIKAHTESSLDSAFLGKKENTSSQESLPAELQEIDADLKEISWQINHIMFQEGTSENDGQVTTDAVNHMVDPSTVNPEWIKYRNNELPKIIESALEDARTELDALEKKVSPDTLKRFRNRISAYSETLRKRLVEIQKQEINVQETTTKRGTNDGSKDKENTPEKSVVEFKKTLEKIRTFKFTEKLVLSEQLDREIEKIGVALESIASSKHGKELDSYTSLNNEVEIRRDILEFKQNVAIARRENTLFRECTEFLKKYPQNTRRNTSIAYLEKEFQVFDELKATKLHFVTDETRNKLCKEGENLLNQLKIDIQKDIEKRNWEKELSETIDNALDVSTKTDDELSALYFQKNRDTDQDNTVDFSKIENDLQKITNVQDTLLDPQRKIKINFQKDETREKFFGKDSDTEETFEDRKNEIYSFLSSFKERLQRIQDKKIRDTESIDRFKGVLTFEKIIEKLKKSPYAKIGNTEIETVLHSLESIQNLGDASYDVIAESGTTTFAEYIEKQKGEQKTVDVPNAEFTLISSLWEQIPEAFGLKNAVLPILEEKFRAAKQRFETKKRKEEEAKEQELKRLEEKRKKNRIILKSEKIVATPDEIKSIDDALEQPGFAQFLNMLDEYFGAESCMNAVEADDFKFIKEKYDSFYAAKEVRFGLVTLFESELKKDFKGKIKIPKEAYDNMTDYVLECAIKNPEQVSEMRKTIHDSLRLPEEVAKAEKDLVDVYALFGGEEGLEKAEAEHKEKQEHLESLKVATGQNKEELIAELAKRGMIGKMDKFKTRLGTVSGYEDKLLDVAQEKTSRQIKEIKNAKNNLTVFGFITGKVSKDEIKEKIDSYIETYGEGAITVEEREKLLETSTESEPQNRFELKSTERRLIVVTIRQRLEKKIAEAESLTQRIEIARKTETASWFDQNKIVKKLIESGDIKKSEYTLKAKLFSGPEYFIKLAAQKIEEELRVSEAHLQNTKEKIKDIETLKRGTLIVYRNAREKMFNGFATAKETKGLIERYIEAELFGEDEMIQDNETIEQRERRTSRDLSRKEKSLKALRLAQERRTTAPSSEIDEIDREFGFEITNGDSAKELEEKLRLKVIESLRVKIKDAFRKLDFENMTPSGLQRVIDHWIYRPPKPATPPPLPPRRKKGNNASQTPQPIPDIQFEDKLEPNEAKVVIREILSEAMDAMRGTDSAPKRILIASVLRKLNQ